MSKSRNLLIILIKATLLIYLFILIINLCREDHEVMKILLPFGVALILYVLKYMDDVREQRRKSRLEHLNNQLEKLYGPLYFNNEISYNYYKMFRKTLNRPNLDEDITDNNATEEEKKQWRLWVEHIFQPINIKQEEIIQQKAYLMDENDENGREKFVLLSLHIAALRSLTIKWKNEDYNKNFVSPEEEFPNEIAEYIKEKHKILKEKQRKLIENEERKIFGIPIFR